MAGRHVSRRLVAALSATLVCTAIGAGAPAVPTPDAPDEQALLTEPTARADAARARVDAAQAEVDAAAALLAAARARADSATDPADRASHEQEAAHLEVRKADAVRRLDAERATLTRLLADEPAPAPATPATEADASVVVLPAPSGPLVATGADPVATPPGPVPAATAPTPVTADTAANLDAYLAAKGSPLAGLGTVFVTESARVGLDPRLLVAISGAETSFGTYGPSQDIRNPFGLGPGMRFPDWPDAIRYAAQNLGGGLYLGDGRVTIPAIQQRWAPRGATNDPSDLNANWIGNVGRNYAELGGDPNGSVFTGVSATALLDLAPSLPTVGMHGRDAAQDALRLLGTPHPADRAGGLDAGTLVQVVYAPYGVALPAEPAQQISRGAPVEPAALMAGDAVFFSTPDGRVVHVGLYLGAGQFIHAPGPGDTVTIGSLYEAQWAQGFAGARRF